ncbi:hypothetical protein F511_35144 [Dorcoceras hygrometricum]|uniref:Uncharacterized protein n=1 Tax=Dorcoceras hygrometricum TaxID=472368 RepID=A0A2Z7BN27_9LAMI|nr:hypothetical protein F511_35144 [Dorcoceras hygrometricum]
MRRLHIGNEQSSDLHDQNVEGELHDKMKKMNIKEFWNVCSKNFTFGRGNHDGSLSGSSYSTLPNKMKNLNLKYSSSTSLDDGVVSGNKSKIVPGPSGDINEPDCWNIANEVGTSHDHIKTNLSHVTKPMHGMHTAASSATLPEAAAPMLVQKKKHGIRAAVDSSIRSTTGRETPSSACTRRPDEINADGNSSKIWPEQLRRGAAAAAWWPTAAAARIQLSVGPQPLWLRNHNLGLAQRIMVKRLATSPHDPLGITDSACKNQLVVVSVQYGPFNPDIPIRSTTIGKSRVAKDPIAMHTSWRSNSDIASVTRVSMTFRVVRTKQYNQDLGLIHSTNGNHLESPNEGSSIDHQVTIYLHAQNITIFPTNETWYFPSQILVSSSGGIILVLTAQSTRNVFRIHSDY